MTQNSLFGAATHSRQDIANAYTPQASGSYSPVPYDALLNTVDRVLQDNGLIIANEQHQLVKPMKDVQHPSAYGQLFSVLNLANLDDSRGEVSFSVGVRSSHDKSLSASICAGSRVMVCSNLSFSAEWIASRKHTGNILTELPLIIDTIVKQFPEARDTQEQLFDTLRDTTITEKQALWMVYQGAKNKAINARDIVPIMDELLCVDSDRNREQHDDGSDTPTLWRLFNAGTQVHKGIQKKNMVSAGSRALDWYSLFNGAVKNGVDTL